MRGITQWNANPYRPMDRAAGPYIGRVMPGADYIEVECFEGRDLWYRMWESGEAFREAACAGSVVRIEGLAAHQDYEIRLCDAEGRAVTRLARTGSVPGTVVNYLHPEDTTYEFSGRSLCSPSLVKLKSGTLLASMDVFAGGAPQNLSLLFASEDRGKTWRYRTELFPCFWGKLFTHRGVLYMLAHATEYGDVLIGASRDEGRTWSAPVRLFAGSGSRLAAGPHKAPMPVIEHRGRLYTAVDHGAWSCGGHASGVLSIDVGADLLCAENWTLSAFLPYNAGWPGAAVGASGGALEGNCIVGPDGELYNLLRYQMTNCVPAKGKALLLSVDAEDPEAAPRFCAFADMEGGSNSKFTALRDPVTGAYVALVNPTSDAAPAARTVVALAVSRDLRSWKIVRTLHDYSACDAKKVGLQYIDFLIDGDDLLYLCRTAMHRARNFHDANYQTFHVLEDFRQYL